MSINKSSYALHHFFQCGKNLSVLKLFSVFPINDPSFRKEISKGIKKWDSECNDSSLCLAEKEFLSALCEQDVMTSRSILCISCLIEESISFQKILSPNVDKILRKIAHTCKQITYSTQSDLLLKVIKLFLQIMQKYRLEVCEDANKQAACSFHDDLKTIITVCLQLLCGCQQSSLLMQMCGSAVGIMLSYLENTEDASQSFLSLLSGENKKSHGFQVFPKIYISSFDPMKLSVSSSLWLIHGVLGCNLEFVYGGNHELQSFLLNLTYKKIMHSCSSDASLQYHGCKTLKLWWSSSLNLLLHCENLHQLFDVEGHFMQTSISMVWNTWDCMVSGLPQIMLQVFDLMLNVDRLTSIDSKLLTISCSHLLSTSSFVKGKYGPLLTIIKKYGASLILQHDPYFIDSLIPCLAINHLAPVVSRVYKSIIQSMMKDHPNDVKLSIWKQEIAPSLVKALVQGPHISRTNISQYWIPVNIDVHRSVFSLLLNLITMSEKSHSSAPVLDNIRLSCVIDVMKTARYRRLVKFDELDQSFIELGVTAFDSCVRGSTFSCICKTSRLSDFISNAEFRLIREHLPKNFNSDCTSFRQHLLICINYFIRRIMCTLALSLKKKKEASSVYSDQCISFLSWLVDLCKRSLNKCCSFQRKQTALVLYNHVLENLCASSSQSTKKTYIPGQDIELVGQVLEKRSIHFKTRSHLTCLIALFQDVFPAIRESAFDCIAQHFPLCMVDSCRSQLENLCQSLLNSPKAQDAESGSSIAAFIFQLITLNRTDVDDDHVMTANSSVLVINWKTCCTFLRDHVMINVNQHISKLESNFLEASRHNPLFGWLLVLSKCVNSMASMKVLQNADPNSLDSIYEFLKSIIARIDYVKLLLLSKVFACTAVNEQGDTLFIASADSEKTESRINAIIKECRVQSTGQNILYDVETELSDTIMLSQDQETVLACSWLNLKNGCQVLQAVALLIQTVDYDSTLDRWSVLLNDIISILITVLSFCRHRGVIESCYECLLKTSAAVFASKHSHVNSIPVKHLNIILDLFCSSTNVPPKNVQGGTVTRRSAGLPLITEAVLSASVAAASKQSTALLSDVMRVMMACIENLIHGTTLLSDDNSDLPAVHALYILKHLFKNTTVGSLVNEYIPQFFPLIVSCLECELWLIRNAAIHLLGAMASRMLGQQHIEEKDASTVMNSLGAVEFFSRYPTLFDAITKIFSKSSAHFRGQRNEDNHKIKKAQFLKEYFCPEMYPVLAVISKLSKEKTDCDKYNFKNLSSNLQNLVGSPSLSLRHLAVKSILALHSHVEITDMSSEFMKCLPSDSYVKDPFVVPLSQNMLHGWLCLILTFLDHLNASSEIFLRLHRNLTERTWLANLHFNRCPITAAVCVEIYRKFVIREAVLDCNKIAEVAINSVLTIDPAVQKRPGYFSFAEASIKLILSTTTIDKLSRIYSMLVAKTHIRMSMAKTTLEWMIERLQTENSHELVQFSRSLLCELWNNKNSLDHQQQNLCLQLFTDMWPHIDDANFEKIEYDLFSENVMLAYHNYSNLSTRCILVKSLSVLVAFDLSYPYLLQSPCAHILHVQSWISIVKQHTYHARASEPLRLASSHGLRIAGSSVLKWILQQCQTDSKKQNLDDHMSIAADVCSAAISHLHDEQVDIRKPACSFVAQCCNKLNSGLVAQSNIATQNFLKFMMEFPAHTAVANALLLFYTNVPSTSGRMNCLFEQEPFNVYVEPHQLALTMHSYLKNLMGNLELDVLPWFNAKIDEVTDLLKSLLCGRLQLDTKFSYGIRTLLYIELLCEVRVSPMEEKFVSKLLDQIAARVPSLQDAAYTYVIALVVLRLLNNDAQPDESKRGQSSDFHWKRVRLLRRFGFSDQLQPY